MDVHNYDRFEEAKDRLRSAILFANWKDVQQALESLEDIDQHLATCSAFAAAQGGCEFCPNNGGGCCVCGNGLN
jgi:hypothetical protein